MLKGSGLDCERVGITLPASLIESIDKSRGAVPRSTFIRITLEKTLKSNSKKNK
jgi:metal-responsive CopG/Arc/MetJ family transcriptional regulator